MTRPDSPAFHAPHRLLCRGRGWQVVFSCGLCGKEYAVLVPQAGQPEQALALAAAEAKLHFNWCRHCGVWVCDEHFNENRGLCTRCAPRICAACGAGVPAGDQFCTVCGAVQFEPSRLP